MEIELRITHKLNKRDNASIKEFIDICTANKCKYLYQSIMYGIPFWLAPAGNHIVRLSFNKPHIEEKIEKKALELLAKRFKIIKTLGIVSPIAIQNKMEEIERVIRREAFMTCNGCHRAIDFDDYCPYCGTKADERLAYCEACELAYVPSYSHCSNCGKKLIRVNATRYDYDAPMDHFFDGVLVKLPDGSAKKR